VAGMKLTSVMGMLCTGFVKSLQRERDGSRLFSPTNPVGSQHALTYITFNPSYPALKEQACRCYPLMSAMLLALHTAFKWKT
jgi:hypothetical protein